MTNADRVKTIFSLLGEVIADSLFPQDPDAETDTAELATVSAESEPKQRPADDPDMWLSVGDLIRLDCCKKHSHNDELRELSRQEFADYRRDPESRFPEPGQQNGHRKYWQLWQIDDWIDDDEKLSVDQFISRRRVGA